MSLSHVFVDDGWAVTSDWSRLRGVGTKGPVKGQYLGRLVKYRVQEICGLQHFDCFAPTNNARGSPSSKPSDRASSLLSASESLASCCDREEGLGR